MTDTPMPKRRDRAIGLQREIVALPPGAALYQSFNPHGHAVDLLVIGVGFPLRRGHSHVLEEWCNGLATPEQMLRVDQRRAGGRG